MEVELTAEQARAQRDGAVPGVESIERISHEQAKATFDCLFADHPEMVASATPEKLPASFRVEIADRAALFRLLGTISDMPGVDDIAY